MSEWQDVAFKSFVIKKSQKKAKNRLKITKPLKQVGAPTVPSAVIWGSNELEAFMCHIGVTVSHSVTMCQIYFIPQLANFLFFNISWAFWWYSVSHCVTVWHMSWVSHLWPSSHMSHMSQYHCCGSLVIKCGIGGLLVIDFKKVRGGGGWGWGWVGQKVLSRPSASASLTGRRQKLAKNGLFFDFQNNFGQKWTNFQVFAADLQKCNFKKLKKKSQKMAKIGWKMQGLK